MKISSIYIYPVKSLGGIKVLSSEFDEKGLLYDRRWMIVDENKKFISQRTHPHMCFLKIFRDGESFIIEDTRNEKEALIIPLKINSGSTSKVNIWSDEVKGFFYNDESRKWISDSLRGNYRFVYMPDTERRLVENSGNKIVSFADAYPFLIIGEESLRDLNSRADTNLEMIRFRPNFVFSGGEPYEEDTWEEFKIGDLAFYGVKLCSRCSITTINPATGEKADEPLKTLSGFRKSSGKVYFGMNLVSESKTGRISAGDQVIVVKRKPRPEFDKK